MDQRVSITAPSGLPPPIVPALLSLVADGQGHVKAVSYGLCQLLGVDSARMLERGAQEIEGRLREPAPWAAIRAALVAGEDWHGLLELEGADGQSHHVECLVIGFAVASDERPLYAAIGHEVVPAAPVVHANRLRMLGQVAAGVLHDLNNVIAAVLGHAELARRHALAGRLPRLSRSLDEVTAAGELCRDISSGLLDLLRERPRATQGPVRLDQAAHALARLLRPTLAEHTELQVAADTPVVGVGISLVAAEQCLLNLVVNARDALGDRGGAITLLATLAQVSAGRCAVCAQAVEGEWAALVCDDTGPGLPPDFLSRAFEAFATTRGRSGGSGLGLAIVAQLVHDARGHVLFASRPRESTRFTLLFEPA